MHCKRLFLWLMIILVPLLAWSQDSAYNQREQFSRKTAVKKLSKSLESSKPDAEIAKDYVELAQKLFSEEEYAKAENYFAQAVSLYTGKKDRELLASAYRELARSQELQGKFEDAVKNYSLSARTTKQKAVKQLNENDVQRLNNRYSPRAQSSYIQSNIDLSKLSDNKEEAAISYQQMAQVKMEMKDNKGAIDELKNALVNVENKPGVAIKIQQDIANTYIADQQYEKAIGINKALVEEVKKTEDPKLEVAQLQNLSNSYFEGSEAQKGIESLKQAYEVALSSGQTMEARDILQQLSSHYRKSGKTTEALKLYDGFIGKLDTLVRADSTLIDDKFFQLYEDRIGQLEKERVLTGELMARKNRFNYVLQGSICLILIFLIFIARALHSINRKNKKIALQALRREMNPHFIFNSLNSVNQFIAQNNELEANKYLSSYSRLMRNVMENSSKDFISLSRETEQLKEYLELEHMRFHDKFAYSIFVDESLDTDTIYIPNMIIQPQLENAIWHGLRYREESGKLAVRFERYKEGVCVNVDDNGIGRQQSCELKTKHQKQHHSRGLNNTCERIELLNKLYNIRINMEIIDKQGEETGVRVVLRFPWINKEMTEDEYSGKNKKRHRRG